MIRGDGWTIRRIIVMPPAFDARGAYSYYGRLKPSADKIEWRAIRKARSKILDGSRHEKKIPLDPLALVYRCVVKNGKAGLHVVTGDIKIFSWRSICGDMLMVTFTLAPDPAKPDDMVKFKALAW